MCEWLWWTTARTCHMPCNRRFPSHLVVLQKIIFQFLCSIPIFVMPFHSAISILWSNRLLLLLLLLLLLFYLSQFHFLLSTICFVYSHVCCQVQLISNGSIRCEFRLFFFTSISGHLYLRSLLLARCRSITFDSIWLGSLFAVRNIHRRHTLLYRMTFILDFLRNVNIEHRTYSWLSGCLFLSHISTYVYMFVYWCELDPLYTLNAYVSPYIGIIINIIVTVVTTDNPFENFSC